MAVIFFAHIGKTGQVQDACIIVQIQLIRFIFALRDINGRVSNIQSTNAASGKHTEPVNKLWCTLSVRACKVRGWRCQYDPVFKINAPDLDR